MAAKEMARTTFSWRERSTLDDDVFWGIGIFLISLFCTILSLFPGSGQKQKTALVRELSFIRSPDRQP